MPPKTPSELREQIERENDQPAKDDHSRTAEGLEVSNPKRSDFLANLEKVSKPDD